MAYAGWGKHPLSVLRMIAVGRLSRKSSMRLKRKIKLENRDELPTPYSQRCRTVFIVFGKFVKIRCITEKRNMQIPHDRVLLRIFIGESDSWRHQALTNAIVMKARERHLAGATVVRRARWVSANQPCATANKNQSASPRTAAHHRNREAKKK